MPSIFEDWEHSAGDSSNPVENGVFIVTGDLAAEKLAAGGNPAGGDLEASDDGLYGDINPLVGAVVTGPTACCPIAGHGTVCKELTATFKTVLESYSNLAPLFSHSLKSSTLTPPSSVNVKPVWTCFAQSNEEISLKRKYLWNENQFLSIGDLSFEL